MSIVRRVWTLAFCVAACGDSEGPAGGSGGDSAAGAPASGGGGSGEGGAAGGGAAPQLPEECQAPVPVAGGECTMEDFTCDAPTTMTACGAVRYRCCGGRWRQKEACDGAEIAPNQPNCDTL